jgi:hypothetical protein
MNRQSLGNDASDESFRYGQELEDPDGFRRTPVSAPLPRRGTDAGRRRGQSAVSSLYAGFELTQEVAVFIR